MVSNLFPARGFSTFDIFVFVSSLAIAMKVLSILWRANGLYVNLALVDGKLTIFSKRTLIISRKASQKLGNSPTWLLLLITISISSYSGEFKRGKAFLFYNSPSLLKEGNTRDGVTNKQLYSPAITSLSLSSPETLEINRYYPMDQGRLRSGIG